MAEKKYRASTGIDSFYYGKLVGETNVVAEVERVEGLQNISVEMPQEIVKAYGDNRAMELATSNGDIAVSSQFHTLPIEDKQVLLGYEVVDGITAAGSTDTSPYVAVVFAKTHEDGSREYVGLPKGMFTRPGIEGATKEDGVEFSNETIEAQFIDRKVDGFADEKSVLFAVEEKGETTNRDALFLKVFGIKHPDEGEGAVEG